MRRGKEPSVLARPRELHWQTFGAALLTACLFFVPFILLRQGYFFMYGDFNVQQIPFYQMCHQAVRSGDWFWNWDTDLGVNFIGSYSFYLLGSPFFLLTLPFPNWMVPYLMGPLLILKFALSAFTAYFYLRRFVRKPVSAMLGGLLYAFSGFAVYNIFFNHFHEAIVFFPLLLLGIEQYMTENRKGVFALAVFICAVSNYFFFVGMAVFAVIYWLVRTLSGRYSITLRRFFGLLFEGAMGVLLGAGLLLPTLLSVLQVSRVGHILSGWDAILYGKEQIYANILEVFFFPPDLPARPVFFPNADVKWSSLGGWLPVFSMVGAIAFLQAKKGHWLRRIIFILLFMAMVPVLNSAFYMFNTSYYARWFYMPVLMLCLATVMSLEDSDAPLNSAFRWTLGITLAFALVIGLFPSGFEDGSITGFGLYSKSNDNVYVYRFIVTCLIAVISLVVLRLLMSQRKYNLRLFYRMSVVSVCVVSVIYGAFFIGTGQSHAFDIENTMIPQLVEGEVELPDGDVDGYRIDTYDGVDNTGMFLGLRSINAFHSIVPASVTEFYEYVGEERGVASRPTVASYAIRPLLSVKYLLNRTGGSEDFTDENGATRMPGYTYLDVIGGYRVYENDCYIPYGFTYDYCVTDYQCDSLPKKERAFMMLKAIVLNETAAQACADILPNISTAYSIGTTTAGAGLDFSEKAYQEDCLARRAQTASTFEVDNKGFTAGITLDRENLVFFSVPYEQGWSATVNGEPTEIYRANVGFMAVRAPAGESVIRFEYTTPGLFAGLAVSAGALLIFVIYLAAMASQKRRRPELWVIEYPEGDELQAQFDRQAHFESMQQAAGFDEAQPTEETRPAEPPLETAQAQPQDLPSDAAFRINFDDEGSGRKRK